MSYRISGLPLAPFAPLFKLDDRRLAALGVVRRLADRQPGFPCRVSLRDAEPGESVLLLNYEHQPASSPYRSSHAIFVRENAREARPAIGETPEFLAIRLLSVRAFDAAGFMTAADVVEGRDLAALIERMLQGDDVAYLHLHNAKPGCYMARVDRAP
ncbi:MAG TPA: DUF1203 domain-containing protein [Steroidobacter sp.]|nr:DUF1203 domain-containing protein [Steroidobacteraceae bacterium]HLS81591.1 DUF1203 domain-containing protein [Steroidobacter sp.]